MDPPIHFSCSNDLSNDLSNASLTLPQEFSWAFKMDRIYFVGCRCRFGLLFAGASYNIANLLQVFLGKELLLNTMPNSLATIMTDQVGNWKIRVKKGSQEVEVEGPAPERVEKMFDELVKKYMKKIASA
jgi:hypothetical protein